MERGSTSGGRELIRNALNRWPAHHILWDLRYHFLLYSGRAGAAIALLTDPESRPTAVNANTIDELVVLARAVERRAPDDVEASLATFRTATLAQIRFAPEAVPVFASLGRADEAFDALEGYYFGTGPMVKAAPPLGRYSRRYTSFLFTPPMASLRADPRFAALLERIGLERYWRESGTTPDFRNA